MIQPVAMPLGEQTVWQPFQLSKLSVGLMVFFCGAGNLASLSTCFASAIRFARNEENVDLCFPSCVVFIGASKNIVLINFRFFGLRAVLHFEALSYFFSI